MSVNNLGNQNAAAGNGGNFITGTIAAYLTAIVAPPIIDLTAPYAYRVLAHHYGEENADLAIWGHFVAVSLLTYVGLNRGVVIVSALIVTAIARVSWRFAM